MRAQQLRTDTMPFTWEIPAAITLSWLVLAVIALPAGQAFAATLTRGGIPWPHGELLASAAHLLRGEPGVGLAPTDQASLPGAGVVYAGVLLTELVVVMAGVLAMAVWWRSGGPGTQWGMARRRDVVPVLGLSNLRRRRHLIRPDLYGEARKL